MAALALLPRKIILIIHEDAGSKRIWIALSSPERTSRYSKSAPQTGFDRLVEKSLERDEISLRLYRERGSPSLARALMSQLGHIWP